MVTPSRSWATVTVAPGSMPAACSWRSTSASVWTLSQMRRHHDRAGQAGEGEVALAGSRRLVGGVGGCPSASSPGIGLPYGERVGRPSSS